MELTDLYKNAVKAVPVVSRTVPFNVFSAVISGIAVEELECKIDSPSSTICFPGESTVTVSRNGHVERNVEMRALRIGDLVDVGGHQFEPIYSFGHFRPDASADYLIIKASSGASITISEHHLIYSNTMETFVKARSLQVGDELIDGAGKTIEVRSIKMIKSTGAFAPFTPSGKLVVNGILASTYAVPFNTDESMKFFGGVVQVSYQWMAHSFEFPHRLACHYTTLFCPVETYTVDGVSTWVSGPLQFFGQVFDWEDAILRDTMLGGAMAVFGLFACIDFVYRYAATLLVVAILAAVSSKHGSWHCVAVGTVKARKSTK
jgi:hypothetical protein